MAFNLATSPFSSTSSWNTPVNSGATYTQLNWPTSTGYNYSVNYDQYSPAVYEASSTDPVVQVSVPDSWGRPAGTISVQMPADANGASGTDGELVVVSGNNVYNFWQFNRTSATTATASAYGETNIETGTGWGTSSPFSNAGTTASGASELAGLLVQAQTDTGTINHALQLVVDGSLVKSGFTGNAIAGDGSSSSGMVQEGELLAIPPGTPMPSGLTPLGQEVFRALQQYGAYVVDNSGNGGATELRAQANAYSDATINPLWQEMGSILPLLEKVTGGTPSSTPSGSTGTTTGSGTGTTTGSGTGTTTGNGTGTTTGSGTGTTTGSGTGTTTGSGTGTTTGSGTGTTTGSGTGTTTGSSGSTHPVAPTLSVADHSLSVSPGGTVSLGLGVSVPHVGDHVSVTISGLPKYETITDKLDGKAFSGSSVTLTAAQVNSGLTLNNSYQGHGQPAATLTVTAHDSTGTPVTSAAQTITVKDPPATTTTSSGTSTPSGGTSSGHHHSHDHHNAAASSSSVTSTTASTATGAGTSTTTSGGSSSGHHHGHDHHNAAASTSSVTSTAASTATGAGTSTTTSGGSTSGHHHWHDHHNAAASTSSVTSTTTSAATGAGTSTTTPGQSSVGGTSIAQWFQNHPGFAAMATTLSEAGGSRLNGVGSHAITTASSTPSASATAYALLNQMMARDFGGDSHFAQAASALSTSSHQQASFLTRPLR
ncbi:MAG: hypothetical protein KGL35_07310 [Bradyrhizobium sp.]|nr:hypothetical protein [Bradyrhizobium sp.]